MSRATRALLENTLFVAFGPKAHGQKHWRVPFLRALPSVVRSVDSRAEAPSRGPERARASPEPENRPPI